MVPLGGPTAWSWIAFQVSSDRKTPPAEKTSTLSATALRSPSPKASPYQAVFCLRQITALPWNDRMSNPLARIA